MNVFEFVLAILLIVFIYKLLETRMRHRHETRTEDPPAEDMQARLDTLEERIRVLERIITDERYDLKREFKDLGA